MSCQPECKTGLGDPISHTVVQLLMTDDHWYLSIPLEDGHRHHAYYRLNQSAKHCDIEPFLIRTYHPSTVHTQYRMVSDIPATWDKLFKSKRCVFNLPKTKIKVYHPVAFRGLADSWIQNCSYDWATMVVVPTQV